MKKIRVKSSTIKIFIISSTMMMKNFMIKNSFLCSVFLKFMVLIDLSYVFLLRKHNSCICIMFLYVYFFQNEKCPSWMAAICMMRMATWYISCLICLLSLYVVCMTLLLLHLKFVIYFSLLIVLHRLYLNIQTF